MQDTPAGQPVLLEMIDINIAPGARCRDLTVARQQTLEITEVTGRGARPRLRPAPPMGWRRAAAVR